MAAAHTHHPVVLRRLEVLRVAEVTPRCRRITIGGPELAAFSRDGLDLVGFRTGAPDDHVKVFLAAPGADGPVLPRQADGHLDWSGPEKPLARDYTVRRFDPEAGEAGELDLDVVLHDEGPGSDWGRTAAPGDAVHLAGPRASHDLPRSGSILAVADITALPAVARWVEEVEPGTTFHAVVAVPDASERQDLAAGAAPGVDLTVDWVEGDDADLVAVVRALPELPPGTYAWVAGELSTITPLRAHLRDDRAIPGERSQVASYWKRGSTDPEAEDMALAGQLLGLVDGLTPMAVRVACTLGLPDLVAAGTTSPAGLVEATGADPLALVALVDHLADRGVFTRPDADRVGLTDLGRLLLDGHPFEARDRLRLDRAEGQMEQAWAGLLHTVTTGTAGYEQVFGGGFWDRLRADDALARSFDSYIAGWSQQWVPLAVAAHDWSGYGHVVDAAGGTGQLLAGILGAAPSARGTLVELPVAVATATEAFAARGLADRATAVEGDIFGALPEADAVVLAQVLHDWPDDDAVRILEVAAEAVGADGRVVVVERLVAPDAPRGDNARMTLLMRNLFGATERTEDGFAALARRAGLALATAQPAGLGLSVLVLAPAAS